MVWRRTRGAYAISLVLLLGVAVGCSGDDGDTGGDTIDLQTFDGPLAEFLGYSSGQQAEMQRRQTARQRELDEKVTACMQAQGFEYRASAPVIPDVVADPRGGLSRAEYVDRYGFGISIDPPAVDTPMEAPEDPNAEYLASLGEAGAEAWNRALYGNVSFGDAAEGDGGATTPTTSAAGGSAAPDDGCYGKASREVFGDPNDPAMGEIGTLFTELEQRFQQDRRVVDAYRTYGECMGDAGFAGLARPEDARSAVSDRLGELFADAPAETPSAEGATPSASVGPQPADARPPMVDTDDLDDRARGEVQEFERRIAKADLRCEAKIARTIVNVRSEYEKRFIEENRTQLETLKRTFG